MERVGGRGVFYAFRDASERVKPGRSESQGRALCDQVDVEMKSGVFQSSPSMSKNAVKCKEREMTYDQSDFVQSVYTQGLSNVSRCCG